MNNWLDRPGYVAVAAFTAGAIVAAVVVIFLLASNGDDDDGDGEQPTATAGSGTAQATSPGEDTPAPGEATSTPKPDATATAATFADPDEALGAFIRDEMQSQHIGDCPSDLAPGEELPEGICSVELYRSDVLVTFSLGLPFSEGIGEAVISRAEDGAWSVLFVQLPPLGEGDPSVGAEAVVFGAGDCLNFRSTPEIADDNVLWCLTDGTKGVVAEGPVEAGGIAWWRLEDLGWASGDYLIAAAE